ncbi:MAG: response regulator transcription factor [Verrucomicrobia bacterium]|nr:response regulator transcription factor [Verrucomicrobiota bacterium]
MATSTENKKPQQTRVMLVEDHPLFRERLALLINKDLGMQVCGEADNIQQAKKLIQSARPDIVIVDISLRGSSGLELIKDLKAQGINVPVLVLSMHDENLYAERVLRAGARGYITKNEASSEVIAAIKAVLAGEVFVSKQMTAKIISNISTTGSNRAGAFGVELLADRELEVFQLIGSGRTLKEIAELLHLGESTVDTYRSRIKVKLGLRNAAEVYLRAGQWVEEARLS